MSALRDNSGKPMLSFILQFPTAVEAHARVKELGAIKYERDNWRKAGKPDWEYLDACLRHISAHMQGEMYASDSGCTHLGHAMWNIMALQDLNYPGITHDPELFAAMCEYWKTRREAEAKGEKFDITPKEWCELDQRARVLEDFIVGNVTDLVGKTDRPIEELQAEANQHIEEHTRKNREEQELQSVILTIFENFVKHLAEKVNLAREKGYREGYANGFGVYKEFLNLFAEDEDWDD